MKEQQLPKKTELSNRIVSYLGSSGPFLTKYADSDIGFHDHVDIIGTITHSQS